MTGLWLGLGTVVVATVLGLLWRSRQGRILPTGTLSADVPDAAPATLPEPVLQQVDDSAAVTLLQLSTPVCARCPQTRALLNELASDTPGVRHAELDLTACPELSDRLGIRSTPTTLAISRTGHELFRVVGMPRRIELLKALEPHL